MRAPFVCCKVCVVKLGSRFSPGTAVRLLWHPPPKKTLTPTPKRPSTPRPNSTNCPPQTPPQPEPSPQPHTPNRRKPPKPPKTAPPKGPLPQCAGRDLLRALRRGGPHCHLLRRAQQAGGSRVRALHAGGRAPRAGGGGGVREPWGGWGSRAGWAGPALTGALPLWWGLRCSGASGAARGCNWSSCGGLYFQATGSDAHHAAPRQRALQRRRLPANSPPAASKTDAGRGRPPPNAPNAPNPPIPPTPQKDGRPRSFEALEADLLKGQKLQGVLTSNEVQEILVAR